MLRDLRRARSRHRIETAPSASNGADGALRADERRERCGGSPPPTISVARAHGARSDGAPRRGQRSGEYARAWNDQRESHVEVRARGAQASVLACDNCVTFNATTRDDQHVVVWKIKDPAANRRA